jgi:CheY-like chemotaxis protein
VEEAVADAGGGIRFAVVELSQQIGASVDDAVALVRSFLRDGDAVFGWHGRVLAAVAGDRATGLAVARRLSSEPQLLAAGMEARLVEDVAELTSDGDLDSQPAHSTRSPQMTSEVRVSVIDDDATVRLMLCRLLEREGWAVVDSSSSEAPLAIFGSSEPNLVVIDADMPGTSGIEFVRLLRDRGERVPVVFFTGTPTPDLVDAADQLGVRVLAKTTPAALVHHRWSMVKAMDAGPLADL